MLLGHMCHRSGVAVNHRYDTIALGDIVGEYCLYVYIYISHDCPMRSLYFRAVLGDFLSANAEINVVEISPMMKSHEKSL